MIQTQYITLDMRPSGVLPVLHCSQYDIGRPLGLVVYNEKRTVNLDIYTCTIEATRSDGTAITTAVTTDGNIGAFATTATMTNKADIYDAQLVIVDSDSNRVASLPFVMRIVEAAMDENSSAIAEDASLYQQYTMSMQTFIAEIRQDMADPGYYNGLTVSTGTYTNSEGSETTYYIVTVPMTDTDDDMIPIEANWDADNSPLAHAQAEHTTLTTNSSLDISSSARPAVIHNGEVLRENTLDTSDYSFTVYVGFDANRGVHEYPITTTAAAMVADGIQEATLAYYRLVTDGVARDVSNIGLSSSQLRVNPRMALFTKSDGSVCFLACDGRDGSNEGLKPEELAALMIANGAVQGWNLDGGGSTSLVLKGSKLNRNIDNQGTADRGNHVTWNVPYKYSNPSIQDAFSQVGIEKQRLIQQLVPDMYTNNVAIVSGVALLDLTDGNYYVQNATDSPTTADDGYVVVFEKYVTSLNLKKVIWYPYAVNGIWMNSYNGSEWIGWRALDVDYGLLKLGTEIPANSNLNSYTTVGNYRITNVATAETISNVPVKRGGRLIVGYTSNSTTQFQQYEDFYGNVYFRNIISGTPSNWVNLSGNKTFFFTLPAASTLRISGLGNLMGKIYARGSGSAGWGVADFVANGNIATHLANVDSGSNTTIAVASDGTSIDITNGYSGTAQLVALTVYSEADYPFNVTATTV